MVPLRQQSLNSFGPRAKTLNSDSGLGPWLSAPLGYALKLSRNSLVFRALGAGALVVRVGSSVFSDLRS